MAGALRKKGSSYQFEYTYKGKRHYGSISCDEVKNEKEAKEKLEEFCVEVRKGNYIEKTYTFFEFSKIWLKEVAEPNVSPISLRVYINCLNNRIFPKLGHLKLTEITPLIINNFINDLKKSSTMYDKRKNTPLTRGSIEKNYGVIRTILEKAYEYELIYNNPCKKVKLNFNNMSSETNRTKKVQAYDIETYHKVLDILKSEKFLKSTSHAFDKRVVIEFALKTGMRRSEIWGVRWEDINYDLQEIKVNKTRQKINGEMKIRNCKTKRSEREVALPTSLVNLLKEYYEYKDRPNKKDFVFDSIDIDNIPAWFRKWQTKNDIPKIRFHDLRHTYATLLLLMPDEVDIKTVSENLGHSTIKRTLDTYAHVQKKHREKLVKAIDNL